ncbi:MAG: hypothetical protein IKE30_08865 [Clostridia bacterium]|nr:hypothetical protein [Clostridia bacterium]
MRDPLNAASVLPEGACLRLDRGECLYVANARPRPSPFFRIGIRGGLWTLSLTECGARQLETRFVPDGGDFLLSDFARLRGRAISGFELRLIEKCLKDRLLNRPADGKALRQAAARCLREGCGGGLFAARLVQAGVCAGGAGAAKS